jgi:hypothetical protein
MWQATSPGLLNATTPLGCDAVIFKMKAGATTNASTWEDRRYRLTTIQAKELNDTAN